MSNVTIRQVHKHYADFHAVKGVSLEIKDKEFVVLVGPSGCGKTTTLRMVAGLETISEGDIMIGNKIVNELPPMDRDIAMVFQNYALYPHMTVYDNMAFGLKMRKFDKAEIAKRVNNAADILDIKDHLIRKPRMLSGGQRQRVALGRAIVRNPQVFLFDEPLSNLDAKLRVQMRVELKKLHQRLATTSIYVTHDQVEAMTLGDRVVVMKDGLIQQVGEPFELYTNPANKYVAGFYRFTGDEFRRHDDRGSGERGLRHQSDDEDPRAGADRGAHGPAQGQARDARHPTGRPAHGHRRRPGRPFVRCGG